MAPMGSGKGTLINRALENHPDLYETVSCTTRDMRPGEKDGINYHFITKEEFEAKVDDGQFLEWAEFAGNKYGTLKGEIMPRIVDPRVVIVEIELQGVQQLLKILPREHMTITYIDAGGWEVLRARAEKRAPMSETEMNARHDRFLIEEASKPLADVIIDNSGNEEDAHAQFEAVMQAAYNKCK